MSDTHAFMLKNLRGEPLEVFRAAQQRAAGEGRTLKFVILQLLRGWVAGYYQLGAAKK